MPGALVTGSAGGIGRALVLALARDGFDVVVHYHTSREEAEATADEARSLGVRATALAADVTDPEAAARLVEDGQSFTGGLQVLVNNVGNYHQGPLDELTVERWHEMFASNLHATFYTCRQVVPHMREAGGGRIINLGYAGSEILKARPRIAPYAIAKSGVILYSKALARTEAPHGITVNVISPGVMENSDSVPDMAAIPAGRLGDLDELVAAARFLVSKEAAYITGTTIEVAGGWNL